MDKIKEYMKGWIRHINFETVLRKVVYEVGYIGLYVEIRFVKRS
jgi:hypothetical protein